MIDRVVIPGEGAPSLLSVTLASARRLSLPQDRCTSARSWSGHRSASNMLDMVVGGGVAASERGGRPQMALAGSVADTVCVAMRQTDVRLSITLFDSCWRSHRSSCA